MHGGILNFSYSPGSKETERILNFYTLPNSCQLRTIISTLSSYLPIFSALAENCAEFSKCSTLFAVTRTAEFTIDYISVVALS